MEANAIKILKKKQAKLIEIAQIVACTFRPFIPSFAIPVLLIIARLSFVNILAGPRCLGLARME